MFRYCVSNRGKEKLIHNGYVYARKYTAKDKHVWKCYGKNESKKPCTATVKLDPNSLNIIEKGKHNHSSDVDEHLKNSQKHVKKRISKINSALKQIYNWKLSQMENKISEDDELKHYATPAHNEVYTYMANVLKLDSSFLITTDVKNIMEIVEVPEMKSVLHNEYCKLQNCPISKEIVLLDHPIFELCIKLLENYKKLHLKHPYVENLITRDYLVEDTKWFLREANVVGEQKTEFLYIMRHTNLGLMGHRPYKRECECGEDCSQNPIHSLNDYMYTTIGSILPVFADNPNAQRLFARRKICRLGRFKDALEFKRYYFSVNDLSV
ncbi:hypothetical protein M3Y94_00642800 [Aphelenchoides besseyi]|nr:hypothetical protein M3Y94_00642800 [Aphelenchoides besseyi]